MRQIPPIKYISLIITIKIVCLSLQFCIEGLSGYSEHFGCTRDVAVAFIHDLPDVIVLEIFQGCHFRIIVDGILEHPYQFVIIPGLGDEIGGSAFQSLDG